MFEQPQLLSYISFSVSEITRYLRALLEGDELLRRVWVRGEISNLARPASGHIYFTLKDAGSALRCVIWRSAAVHLPVTLRDGMAVEALGAIGIYERDGQYQLYVETVRAVGEGLLYQEFMRRKEKLEAEGLFDPARKRPIPERPSVIGIVTSPIAAALQDVLNTLRQRYPLATVFLSPTAVQGDAAPREIVAALQRLNEAVKPDVILLVRGGGSLEDLWAFNDEDVVRAVAGSAAPVVSGVGHETDFTLVDFAADLRAPTPTGAAVLATPELDEIYDELRTLLVRLESGMADHLEVASRQVGELRVRLDYLSPLWRIQNALQRVDELQERLFHNTQRGLALRAMKTTSLQQRLLALSPLAVLQRGYALVELQDGSLLRSVRQVSAGDEIGVRLSDGRMKATVRSTHRDEEKKKDG